VDSYWRKIRGTATPEPRFVERKIILRFFAFVNRLQFYSGNLKRFLNDYMASYAPSNPEQIKAQANIFRQTFQNIYITFSGPTTRGCTACRRKPHDLPEPSAKLPIRGNVVFPAVRRQPARTN
jgi:hypothetical protein